MHSALFLSLLLTANAAVVPSVRPRALPPGCEEWYEEIEMVEFNDGPTSSGDAGIGAEFETLGIQFYNKKCGLEDTFAAKRKTIQGHSGTNYVLSVDTSVEQGKGTLSAEYVLDGRNIRVGAEGAGSAAAAGKAAYDDVMNWKPWSESPANEAIIENYPECPDPWTVLHLTQNTDKDHIPWIPQVTTSMPLEALYALMKENVQGVTNGRNVLNGLIPRSRGQNLQLVTKEYFQALSPKIDIDKVNDAVLGFCTLVLSYAKAANKPINPHDHNVIEMSPKSWIPFMPRTEFVTIYQAVKSVFSPAGELFDIFNTLACYKTDDNLQVSLDEVYCTGDPKDPVPGDTFGGLKYKYIGDFPKSDVPATLEIKEWIQKIDAGSPSPDLFTTFDKNYDGSIGGLGDKVEKMYNQDRRTAPLFEFRDLDPIYTPGFEDFMGRVDESIQGLHRTFASRPTRKMRVKRQNSASSCTPPTAINSTSGPITSPPPMPTCTVQYEDPDQGINTMGCICGSSTLPLLTVPSATDMAQSCSYTAIPSNATNPITIQTESWTSNCQACTLVGGIADVPTCTAVSGCTPTADPTPTPTFAVFLSNNSIPIGDDNNANGGADLRKDVFTKLKALCPDDATACDSTTDAEIDEIPTVVGGGEEYETLKFTIQDSHYDTTDDRDRMLAAAVSSWQQAVGKSCKQVEYKFPADPTASGCGDGPVKRGLIPRNITALEKRTPICDECEPPVMECTYTATVCAGPDHISTVFAGKGNAYENHMDIGLSWKLDGDSFDEFICDAIIDGLSELALVVAPELVEAEIFEDIEFETLCAQLVGDE